MNLPENEVAMILNGIKDFILIISPNRDILQVNDAFLKHMHYTRDQVVGRKCFEVFREIDREDSNCDRACPLKEVMKTRQHYQAELCRLGNDGCPRYMELTLYPIWDKQGNLEKFIEISRDITKRKANQIKTQDRLLQMVEERTQKLNDTHKQLLHQDKMASLGRLSSSVVHEINNPASGILNLALLSKRILKEDIPSEKNIETILKYLDLMETETRRISRIVGNLLVFARQSKIEIARLDVNELLDQTLLLNANLLRIHGVEVIEKMERNIPLVTGSEDQLKQVFMNLVSNAVESMSGMPGGKLTLETYSSPADKTVTIRFLDTGPGIPEELKSKIFEPFFTTKKKGKGVGLGLSVVYGIINDHNGSITVNSEQGKGSVFTITLK